jgi:hypothetical protein
MMGEFRWVRQQLPIIRKNKEVESRLNMNLKEED